MSVSNSKDLERLFAAIDNPKKIAVYENAPGNWVKHFFGQDDEIKLPDGIEPAKVRWFDKKDEALDFWNKQASIALGGDN